MSEFICIAQLRSAVAAGDVHTALSLLDRHPDLATAPLTPPLALPPGVVHQRSYVVHSLAGCDRAGPVLERALALGADPNARGLNDDTPLHVAAWHGNVAAMAALLARGADLEARNDVGYTPLDLTYHAFDDPAGHDFLLARGAEPGLVPALWFDRLDLLDRLARSADPDRVRGRAPDPDLLDSLAEEGPHADYKMHILQWLDLGPDEDERWRLDPGTLVDAVYRGDADKALWALNLRPWLATTPIPLGGAGGTPLACLLAGWPGLRPVLDRAFVLGASVADRDPDGRTPLHAAAWAGNVEAMPPLLARGADVEARDAAGLTPLDLTYRPADPAGFDLLLAHGATPGLLPALAHDRLDVLAGLARGRTWADLRGRAPDLALVWELAGDGPRAAEKLAVLDRLGMPVG